MINKLSLKDPLGQIFGKGITSVGALSHNDIIIMNKINELVEAANNLCQCRAGTKDKNHG